MSKISWNLDQLKHQLSSRKEIKAWIVTQEHVHRRERYFMSENSQLITDQDRNIHSRNISVKLLVFGTKQGRQGEITKKLFPSLPVKEQIDAAIDAAKQTDHQQWDLPDEVPTHYPELLTADPKMAEDLDSVMEETTQLVNLAVNKKRQTLFNSAELFLSLHNREFHLSNGLIHRASQSRIYTEAAFSFSRPGLDRQNHSDEYLSTQWGVSLNHLPIEKLFDEASDRAEHSLDINKPETGKYSVIVDAEVLMTLLQGHISQLYAANSYHGLPFIKPGEELIPASTGDLLTVSLDPTLPYGANTVAVSEQGILQAPLKLVSKNRVMATATDKQYSDYLRLPTTTVRGSLVIEPGALSYDELIQSAPQVIEILQFSGLFADPNSGTFSSEIRLARLYNNLTGKVTYLKGGSLSGSIQENFKGLKLSNRQVHRAHFSSDSSNGQGYQGPEYALLSEVSIVG